jgi:hypothetical protein
MAYFNGNNWCRNCPDCGKQLTYTGKNAKYNATYQETKSCRSCWQLGHRHPNFGMPAYNKGVPMSEKQRHQLSVIKKGTKRTLASREKQGNSIKGKNHHQFGKPLTLEQKEKISTSLQGRPSSFKGRKMTLEQRKRCSLSHIGHKHSEETKRKNRLATINYIMLKNGGIRPSYNKEACQYFDSLSKNNGWNLRHALNGGEYYINELGYFIDAYDEKKNIVVEYDEPYHDRPQQKDKDASRQKNIIRYLSPNEFWRFHENTKTLVCIHRK